MLENKPDKKYQWIELAALLPDGKMVRGKFVGIEDNEAIENFRNQFNNKDVFYGICQYEKPNYKSGFISSVFFDIDFKEDLSATRESAITLCEMLMDRIGIPPDQIEIYFSGNKGFHVMVPCEVFQPFHSPYILPLYKKMAQRAEQAGVKFIDKGVYTNRRLWRLPNSINRKSSLYKLPISYEELRDIGMDKILLMAKSSRPENTLVDPRPIVEAIKWYRKAIKCMNEVPKQLSCKKINSQFKKGWRVVPCIKAMQKAAIPDGIRHEAYLTMARYYGYLNMHQDEMLERLEAIDKRNPIQNPDSIERVIKFGCEHPGFPGCDSILKKYCQKERCFYAKLKATKVEVIPKPSLGG